MSIIIGAITILPTILVDRLDIKEGYYVLLLLVALVLVLLYYRKLYYQYASFRNLLVTGSSVVILGLVLNFALESIHLSVIGEDGLQQMIDRKVEKRIKDYDGSKLNIFDIENKVIEDTKTNTIEEVVGIIMGVMMLILLIFILSLILRTDKSPREEASAQVLPQNNLQELP